jgi:fumarylacetoacetase
MSRLIRSWIESANDAANPFPLNNLPYGVFSTPDFDPRCGVAIGDQILDIEALEKAGLFRLGEKALFNQAVWNPLMEAGSRQWSAFRMRLIELLIEGGETSLSGNKELRTRALIDASQTQLYMPIKVAEYTDFYSGKNHATNVGTMFRGAENALPSNWLHMPIGYNGRASSVVVSNTDIQRPWGQLKSPEFDTPIFAPSRRFDIELEMGAIVGTASRGPISVAEADSNIFGYVLLNDWSARDIQAWEYQPLGPFQAKATATSISPWIVTKAALEPFRTSTPEREKELLPHLQEPKPLLYSVELEIDLCPEGGTKSRLSKTNMDQLYYSSAQQLAHHTTSGCPMSVGDLLGTGTISGSTKKERGSLLELSWGGKEPIDLGGGVSRTFVEDRDTLTLHGNALGDGYRIGFGDCIGKVIAAASDPYQR